MSYEITPEQRKLAELGRYMMDLALAEKDLEYSGRLADLGDKLTTVGAPNGFKLHTLEANELTLLNGVYEDFNIWLARKREEHTS